MSGSRMRISVWRFCESVSPWQTSLNSSKKLSEKRNVIYYWWLSSRLYNSLTLQIMFAVAKTKKKNHPQPHLLDVLERDLLALPGRHGEDVHLQRGQSERGVVLQLRPEPLQAHVVTTLRGKRWESKVFMRIPTSVFRACEERFICPPSSSGSRSASSLSWMKFSAFLARESFKGIQFPVLDEGLGSAKRWNLTGEKKKKMGFSPPRLLDVTNYQKNPMGKREVIYRGAAVVEDFIC